MDFGGGPGTGLLAVASRGLQKIKRIALEYASGMSEVAKIAQNIVGSRCDLNTEHQLVSPQFLQDIDKASKCKPTIIIFSYLFAQSLTSAFVSALARAIRSLDTVHTSIVYTNPVGPSAAWMPESDIHFWYREFCNEMGHEPRIETIPYKYGAVANLKLPVERDGECASEVWRIN